MLTRIMKLATISVLLLAALFWSYAPKIGLSLRFLVGLGAILVARQAVQARRFLWAAGFLSITILFNPLVRLVPFHGDLPLLIVIGATVPFVVALRDLRTQPLLSIPSITDPAARRISL